jgi:hypothetical protein
MGHYTLDLRTDSGTTFRVRADADQVEAMRYAAVLAKQTSTGSPGWRS